MCESQVDVELEKLHRIGKPHPPPNLRRQVLDEGCMVPVKPIPDIEDVHSQLVNEVLAGDRIGSSQVDDRVACRAGLR